jgi:Periplasmic serine proteases (ClpP class)
VSDLPTWSEILTEILAKIKSDPQAIDNVRKGYLRELADYVKKPIILYATRWMDQPVFDQLDVQINWADKEAFMEVVHGIRERELVLILHSPGGQIEPTQAIVDYLRQKFENITVIVPDAAMSAATLIALAADKILMGSHSNLGPIDPQFILQTP